ncbi:MULTISPECIES: amino acid ABC transporter permease [unclassified Thermoactinomyces]|uniref:amino acid ABC transporter permease n=1 Tax=unclassified Thermoactinomyces TaxID=2634588 RepID=UPI0018DDCE5F|nr:MULTISPECIES: amino acid ABC transporter permease [unclassified Thermoactinomyces]MBH8605058.1 amino acid ABC transporter permease [Thermoactinomyces sp. CICC 10522]MBH8606314.1 amino acid ABC transporter permease [Thermoactinomyces sp. CICC 10521]
MITLLEIFQTTFDEFMQAAWQTVQLTFWSLLLATAIGLFFAFCRLSGNPVLKGMALLYIAIIRGTPLIVQIVTLYFGLAEFVVLDSFTAGVIALAVHAGAYIAEIFRGAIQSIENGQMEAARSLGMSYWLAMRRIILPQAFRRSIPALGNQFIIGLKDSSLVAYIGGTELWASGLGAAADNFRQFPTYLVNGLYYLALILIFTFMLRWLEKRLNVEQRSVGA